MKVSVIIPFYNGVDWLFDAVNSVLNQTYGNIEIIVINDGSPEPIDSFLELYGDKIIYVYKENGGPASARNLGLKYATGYYIAFLDSDDVWLPTKTERQIEFMNNCGAVWSHTGFYNWYPLKNNKLIRKFNSNDFGNVYLKSFISLRANTPAIIIIKKYLDLHKEFIFPEKMRYSQDSYLWSLIAYHYPLALIEEPLVKVRQRGTNADLRSLVRFKSKSIIYKDLRSGVFNDIPRFVIFIYCLYYIGFKLINIFQFRLKLRYELLEFLGKVLWVVPFLIERIYLLYIGKSKDYHYRLK